MPLEPPDGYVAFVAAHLEPLRRQAAAMVGDADQLYPDVLTDVAARWTWLALLTRLGRSDAAEACLHQRFARRSQRWFQEQPDPRFAADVRVLPASSAPGASVSGLGLGPGASAPGASAPGASVSGPGLGPGAVVPLAPSAAVRLAPQVGGSVAARPGADAFAEAAIAWWHAYEARRRMWYLAGVAAVFVFFAFVVRQDVGSAAVVAPLFGRMVR